MEFSAKVGTHSSCRVKIKYARKVSREGSFVKFKRLPIEKGQKWESAKVDRVDDFEGWIMLRLSLF